MKNIEGIPANPNNEENYEKLSPKETKGSINKSSENTETLNAQHIEEVRANLDKSDWRNELKEVFGDVWFRVPSQETPEEIVRTIDPTLQYVGKVPGGDRSASNYLYLVKDPSDGKEKILKIAAAPAAVLPHKFFKPPESYKYNETSAMKEHYILDRLTKAGVKGVPQLYKTYNSLVGERSEDLFTAMLRENVRGENFDEQERNEDFFIKLYKLFCDLVSEGINIPRDVDNGGNILVGQGNQPYILDFEESAAYEKPKPPFGELYEWVETKAEEIRINSLVNHWSESGTLVKRLLSKWKYLPKVLNLIEYKKPNYAGK